MAKTSKNQWDFGDLFQPSAPPRSAEKPAAPAPRSSPPEAPPSGPVPRPTEAAAPVRRDPLTVTELTQGIRRQLESAFGAVRVTGEVSNYRLQASGHAYFVLKDAQAQLSCVLFRGQGGSGRTQLKDGVRVTLGGEITVYEPRGQYQLRVTQVELEGVGALQAAFERLKARLQAEGLFDPARKRPLPAFPRRVGLVTSPTGAAIRDVLHVVERRFAGLEFVLVPVRVQGEGAAEMIADAVRSLNEWARETPGGLDVILVTRGGGSLEDLWAFNEEIVARALAVSDVPVLSAVGHEIDFTIADFVADLRAATPSAAAEILTAGYVAAAGRVVELSRRLPAVFGRSMDGLQERLDRCWAALARLHPRRQLEARAQRVDELTLSLTRVGRRRWRESVQAASNAARRLALRRPSAVLALRRREWDELTRRLVAAVRSQQGRWRDRTDRARRSLDLLSPQSVLDRGYSLTFDAASGQLLRAAAAVETGRRLRTRLASGEIESVVERRGTDGAGD